METTNKTTEHGVHNSKIHDNAAHILFLYFRNPVILTL